MSGHDPPFGLAVRNEKPLLYPWVYKSPPTRMSRLTIARIVAYDTFMASPCATSTSQAPAHIASSPQPTMMRRTTSILLQSEPCGMRVADLRIPHPSPTFPKCTVLDRVQFRRLQPHTSKMASRLAHDPGDACVDAVHYTGVLRVQGPDKRSYGT
jgi:hypothetical protein